MGRKRFTPEQIIIKLREIEMYNNKGMDITQACRHAGISDQTYYKWRKQYGGMKIEQANRP